MLVQCLGRCANIYTTLDAHTIFIIIILTNIDAGLMLVNIGSMLGQCLWRYPSIETILENIPYSSFHVGPMLI